MDSAQTLARSPASDGPSVDAALVLGRYRLERHLGAGGFGAVWQARDERLGRDVAVKVVPRGPQADEPRLEREALAAARLGHPGIVTLYEAGADAGNCYLVSELVRGPTLARLIAEHALSDRDVLRIGVALCDALAHAHGRGVIHRDIKPGNVIVPARPESAAEVAKLTDFGVAHLAGDDGLTHTGDVVGTIAYMAPEQAEGRRVTTAADLYALALVLYEALAGENPVRGNGPADTARRVGRPIGALARRRPDLPAGLGAAIDRALVNDPGARGSVEELRDALADAFPQTDDADGLIAGSPVEGLPVTTTRGGRLAAGAAAGALAGLAAQLMPGGPPASPAAVAACVALLVALLPRAGWLAAAGATLAGLAASAPSGAGRPGLALVALPAVAAIPLLLRRRPAVWSVAALAPALGALSLAPAYPVIAGQARRWTTRAALGAAGAVWLLAASAIAGDDLWLARPAGLGEPSAWGGSASRAIESALDPLLIWQSLALVALSACAAALLPLLVRGRAAGADLAGAAAWAAGVAIAAGVIASSLPSGAGVPSDLAATAGAAAAAVLAVAIAALRGERRVAVA